MCCAVRGAVDIFRVWLAAAAVGCGEAALRGGMRAAADDPLTLLTGRATDRCGKTALSGAQHVCVRPVRLGLRSGAANAC
jgi:hypothetical protein